jgi:sugar phosphate isomerase/epimerase
MPTSPTVRIAGVNDEPSPSWDLDEGLDVLDELGIKFIELRAANGEMVDQMNDETFIRVADRIKERGFTVTTYLGQVGRALPDEAIRTQDIAHITRAVQRADYLGTTQLRTMGYKKGDAGTDWFAIAIEMYTAMTELAGAGNKILILENPPNATSAVYTALEVLQALQEVNSPNFRLNFDPGNFGAHGEVGIDLFETFKDYITNVHVKDIREPGNKDTNRETRPAFCIAGDGKCEYPEIFKRLREMNYSGCITAEPHLLHSEQFHVSGRENYIEAVNRILQLLEEAGYSVQKA